MRRDMKETKQFPVEAGQPTAGGPDLYAFGELYCQQQNCGPRQFAWQILRRCLHHPILTPPAWLIYRTRTQLLRLDTNLIGLVSKIDNFTEFRNTVDAYDGFDRHHPANNFFRRTLHLRLSRRKLIKLAHQVFERAKQI